MTEIVEASGQVAEAPDPHDVPWYRDLKEGTGSAEGLDPRLREALALSTEPQATEQAAAAELIPWRQDLKDGTGAAKDLDPLLRAALAQATHVTAIKQAGDTIANNNELRAASEIAAKLAELPKHQSDAMQGHNPHDPNDSSSEG